MVTETSSCYMGEYLHGMLRAVPSSQQAVLPMTSPLNQAELQFPAINLTQLSENSVRYTLLPGN